LFEKSTKQLTCCTYSIQLMCKFSTGFTTFNCIENIYIKLNKLMAKKKRSKYYVHVWIYLCIIENNDLFASVINVIVYQKSNFSVDLIHFVVVIISSTILLTRKLFLFEFEMFNTSMHYCTALPVFVARVRFSLLKQSS